MGGKSGLIGWICMTNWYYALRSRWRPQ